METYRLESIPNHLFVTEVIKWMNVSSMGRLSSSCCHFFNILKDVLKRSERKYIHYRNFVRNHAVHNFWRVNLQRRFAEEVCPLSERIPETESFDVNWLGLGTCFLSLPSQSWHEVDVIESISMEVYERIAEKPVRLCISVGGQTVQSVISSDIQPTDDGRFVIHFRLDTPFLRYLVQNLTRFFFFSMTGPSRNPLRIERVTTEGYRIPGLQQHDQGIVGCECRYHAERQMFVRNVTRDLKVQWNVLLYIRRQVALTFDSGVCEPRTLSQLKKKMKENHLKFPQSILPKHTTI